MLVKVFGEVLTLLFIAYLIFTVFQHLWYLGKHSICIEQKAFVHASRTRTVHQRDDILPHREFLNHVFCHMVQGKGVIEKADLELR